MPYIQSVTYQQNPMWQKWGLCHTLTKNIDQHYAFSDLEYQLIEDYYNAVSRCHDRVCFYLEQYPSYPYRTVGHYYFDVVLLVAEEDFKKAQQVLKYFYDKKKRFQKERDAK